MLQMLNFIGFTVIWLDLVLVFEEKVLELLEIEHKQQKLLLN